MAEPVNRTPRRDVPKLELHLSYACDIDCVACTRASFLKKPHTRNLTLDDVEYAFAQCDEMKYEARVIIIGGEPTLHPHFYEICRRAVAWSINHQPDNFVQVFSNGHSETARMWCDRVRTELNCSIFTDEWKPERRVGGEVGKPEWHFNTFVSPADAGLPNQGPCYQHSSIICGIGYDAHGFTLCPMGGTISTLLGAPEGVIRSRRLADLFDPEWAKRATEEMCKHCGYAIWNRLGTPDEKGAHDRYSDVQPLGQAGTRMSPTWQAAFAGRK